MTNTTKVVPMLTPQEIATWHKAQQAALGNPELTEHLNTATKDIVWDLTGDDYKEKLKNYVRRAKRAEIAAWEQWQKQQQIDELANEVF